LILLLLQGACFHFRAAFALALKRICGGVVPAACGPAAASSGASPPAVAALAAAVGDSITRRVTAPAAAVSRLGAGAPLPPARQLATAASSPPTARLPKMSFKEPKSPAFFAARGGGGGGGGGDAA
jgi:hypothetical protein